MPESVVCVDVMADVVWYLLQLLVERMEEPLTRNRTIAPERAPNPHPYTREQAAAFLKAAINRNLDDPVLSHLDIDSAAQIRALVNPADVPPLLSILEDDSVDAIDAWLRNRIASVVLTRRTRHVTDAGEVMEKIYRDRAEETFLEYWPTLRGIALALASQGMDDTRAWHFVNRINELPKLLQANCDASESYHVHGRSTTIELYVSRLNNTSMDDEACLWELTYLGERGDALSGSVERRDILKAIERRARDAETTAFAEYCHKIIRRINRRRPTK